eukprot:CAMPEP_0113665520 /NCGR_PEP_ID=MMETSP0038_2-20120614/2350_1 /TAXON_ID=2898 /ORGANISM="Cryptomonas paramecium" /LENGTH=71 /DNA_ID=CAMNT_0000580881 /DNA_START=252 /DNA_END=464 /DNA_ORIENTATION=- /assembly_acc=CAM_ASM_000170
MNTVAMARTRIWIEHLERRERHAHIAFTSVTTSNRPYRTSKPTKRFSSGLQDRGSATRAVQALRAALCGGP